MFFYVLIIYLIVKILVLSLQCFDTAGWATGRASHPVNIGCWFVGGDDLTGVLHIL